MQNRTHGPYCALGFTSNFGSGAAGVATSPGGCDGAQDSRCGSRKPDSSGTCSPDTTPITYAPSNRGPLTGVKLTEPGSCYARLGRIAPTLRASAGSGQGATFTVNTFRQTVTGNTGFHYWEVSSISVSGGTGYSNGDQVVVRHSVGDTIETQATATLSVNANGVPTSVSVQNKGRYYREDLDAQPYVANITVTPCGFGTGAQISASVETNTRSPQFGQIKGLTITNGGSNYLAWRWANTCRNSLNGKSIVLRASSPEELTSLHAKACYGTGFCGRIMPIGERVQPNCVEVVGNGTGNISATMVQATDDDGLPYWKLSGVSASGGRGYGSAPGTFTASVRIRPSAAGTMPVVVLSFAGGVLTGASIGNAGAFYVNCDYDGGPTPVKKAEIISRGSGYAKRGRQAPSVSLSATGGTGATLPPTLATTKDGCGLDYWYISSVNASGGSGYTNGQKLTITLGSGGTAESPATVTLTTTDNEQSGVKGIVSGATVVDGGRYYRESNSLPPYVASVEIEVDQAEGSSGSGAVIVPLIDTNPASSGFGQITRLTVAQRGGGYTLYGASKSCAYTGQCGATLTFRGVNKEPELTVGSATYRTTDAVGNCSTLPSPATVLHSVSEGSVSISRGGVWNSRAACPCDNDGCTTYEQEECGGNRPPTVTYCCGGECDECNPCPASCYCNEGRCEPCREAGKNGEPCPPECGENPFGGGCLGGCQDYPMPNSVTVSIGGFKLKDAGSGRSCPQGVHAAADGKWPSHHRGQVALQENNNAADAIEAFKGDFVLERNGNDGSSWAGPFHFQKPGNWSGRYGGIFSVGPISVGIRYVISCTNGCGIMLMGFGHDGTFDRMYMIGPALMDQCPGGTDAMPVDGQDGTYEMEVATLTGLSGVTCQLDGSHKLEHNAKTGDNVMLWTASSSFSWAVPNHYWLGSVTAQRNYD